MAIIKCPECNSDISDKAETCPKCGYPIAAKLAQGEQLDTSSTPAETADMLVPEANAGAEDTDVSSAQMADASSPETPAKPKTSRKKILAIGIIAGAVIIVAAAVIAFVIGQNNAKNSYNNYIDTLNSAKTEMLTGGAAAENLSNTTKRIWYSAIYDDYRYEWDDDIAPYYSDDFNVAIGSYFDSSKAKGYVSDIQDSQSRMKRIMTNLQNPPDGLESAYEAVCNAYDVYTSFTNLAASPSGNYTSYCSGINDGDSGLIDKLDALDTRIPSKK